MVMVDRDTGSYWWQVAGSAIVGERTGQSLETVPSQMARFEDWIAEHPETLVLERPSADRDYSRDRFEGYASRVDQGNVPFPVSEEALADGRLPAGATVVAVQIDDAVVAWPVNPATDIEVTVGDQELQVITDGTGGRVVDLASGEDLPSRTSLWFAMVSSFPEVELG